MGSSRISTGASAGARGRREPLALSRPRAGSRPRRRASRARRAGRRPSRRVARSSAARSSWSEASGRGEEVRADRGIEDVGVLAGENVRRTSSWRYSRASRPAIATRPSAGSRKRRSRLATVVLGALSPTSASRRPGGGPGRPRRAPATRGPGSRGHSFQSDRGPPGGSRCSRAAHGRLTVGQLEDARARGRVVPELGCRGRERRNGIEGGQREQRERRHEHAVERPASWAATATASTPAAVAPATRRLSPSARPAVSASRRLRRTSSASAVRIRSRVSASRPQATSSGAPRSSSTSSASAAARRGLHPACGAGQRQRERGDREAAGEQSGGEDDRGQRERKTGQARYAGAADEERDERRAERPGVEALE